jgi:hypothetical protein
VVTGGPTYANQFQNTTAASGDWRQKTGSDLRGAGTSDSTNGATDIAGTARPQSGNWDIGCWQLQAPGAIITADARLSLEAAATQWVAPSLPVEHLGTQLADLGLLLGFFATQSADLRTPSELVRLIGGPLGLLTELGGEVWIDASGGFESLATAVDDWYVAAEWLTSSLGHVAAPGEFATALDCDGSTPAEWLGLAVLTADAVLPIEWSRLLPAPVLVSLKRLLVSPGKRRLLATSGRLRLLRQL